MGLHRALLTCAGKLRASSRPKLLLVFGLIAGTVATVAQQATTVPPLPPPRPGYNFPARQTLTYSVDWRVFPAGSTVMHLQQEGDEEHVTVTADSLGAINLIYRVSDRFQSSFNRRTGCSSGFAKQIQEGRRQVTTDLRFDYAAGKAILNEKNVVKGTSKHQETPVGPCVTDLLSAIFYPPSQPLVVGQSFEVPLADAMRTVIVTMKVEARETVHTPLGNFQTIRVQPTADAGVVKARGDIWLWYTDDDRHIPVQMRARLFWGTITFRLVSLEQK